MAIKKEHFIFYVARCDHCGYWFYFDNPKPFFNKKNFLKALDDKGWCVLSDWIVYCDDCP